VSGAVLPGPETAFPPFEQKSSAMWRKHTAISYFSKIPLLLVFYLVLNDIKMNDFAFNI
jgi:hypothetical protein